MKNIKISSVIYISFAALISGLILGHIDMRQKEPIKVDYIIKSEYMTVTGVVTGLQYASEVDYTYFNIGDTVKIGNIEGVIVRKYVNGKKSE